MYIKRYTIASFILMVLVGWFVYVSTDGKEVALSFMGINFPPIYIAFLVIIPLFLLYVASVLHMVFYSMLEGFKLKKHEKDYHKLIDALCDALLAKENRTHDFNTDRYKLLGKVVDNSKIFPQTEALLDIEEEKIKNIVEIIHKIKNGEVVNLKKLNLSSSNPLMIQNGMNRYKSGELSAEEILINSKNYTEDFLRSIFGDFVESAGGEKIMKYYKEFITKESLFKIIERIGKEENGIDLDVDSIVELLNSVDLSSEKYLQIAKTVAKGMMPENRLKLFEILSEKDENATEAYLYTAYDLEIMELADEILESSPPEEYKNFRAYKLLKECNQNYNIDLFV